MPAVLVEIADAVVAALNAATFSLSFNAERAYAPVNDTVDLSTLEVTVAARAWTPTAITRAMTDNEYIVDIGVQKRLTPGLATNGQINAEADPLMLLVEEITDLFQRKPLEGYTTAANMLTAPEQPIYLDEHMRDHRVFSAVVRLTLRKTRAL